RSEGRPVAQKDRRSPSSSGQLFIWGLGAGCWGLGVGTWISPLSSSEHRLVLRLFPFSPFRPLPHQSQSLLPQGSSSLMKYRKAKRDSVHRRLSQSLLPQGDSSSSRKHLQRPSIAAAVLH